MSPLVTSMTTTDAGLVADPPRRILVQVGVDRELDGAAAAVGLGLELLDQLAARGDLDPLAAGLAAKRRLERLLEAFLADLDAGDEQQRVLVLLLIFVGGGRADIADELADRGPAGIEAREAARGGDAGQLGQADRDRGILLVRDIVGDRDRLEAARCLASSRVDPLDLVAAAASGARRRSAMIFAAVDQLLRDDVDAEARPVDRDRLAVAVDDPAAARRHRDQLDPVALASSWYFSFSATRASPCVRPAGRRPPPARRRAASSAAKR